jgi:hypothetical protein
MNNDSSTGGSIQPVPQFPVVSGSLTFQQFLQSVFADISGLPGSLVRPSWQPEMPDQPDGCVNWMAFGVTNNEAGDNAYVGSAVVSSQIVNVTQRMEELEILCSFYGPLSQEYMQLTRDGFQLGQNLEALTTAGMGFVDARRGHRLPENVNGIWIDRWQMSFFLRRQILRAYPVLTFLSTSGTISAVLDSGNIKNVSWNQTV